MQPLVIEVGYLKWMDGQTDKLESQKPFDSELM